MLPDIVFVCAILGRWAGRGNCEALKQKGLTDDKSLCVNRRAAARAALRFRASCAFTQAIGAWQSAMMALICASRTWISAL
jgi:hypothetical protein